MSVLIYKFLSSFIVYVSLLILYWYIFYSGILIYPLP